VKKEKQEENQPHFFGCDLYFRIKLTRERKGLDIALSFVVQKEGRRGEREKKKKKIQTTEVVKIMLKTACDLELTWFMLVDLIVLALFPSSIKPISSSYSETRSLG